MTDVRPSNVEMDVGYTSFSVGVSLTVVRPPSENNAAEYTRSSVEMSLTAVRPSIELTAVRTSMVLDVCPSVKGEKCRQRASADIFVGVGGVVSRSCRFCFDFCLRPHLMSLKQKEELEEWGVGVGRGIITRRGPVRSTSESSVEILASGRQV